MANLMYPDYEYEEDEEFADYYDYDYATLDEDEAGEEAWPADGVGDDQIGLSSQEVLEYCVVPTLSSTAVQLAALLAWATLFSLAAKTVNVPGPLRHVLSGIFGCSTLWQVFGSRSLFLAGQVACGCLSVSLASTCTKARLVSPRHAAWGITVLCLTYLLVCELWLVEATVWHSVRGAQMIVLMKVISYTHDTYNCSTDGEGDHNENANLKHTQTSPKKKETCEDSVITLANSKDSMPESCDDVDGCVKNKLSTGGFEDEKESFKEYPEKTSHRIVSCRRKKVLIETSGEQRISSDNELSSSFLKYRKSKPKKSSTEEAFKSKDGTSSQTSCWAGRENLSHQSQALWRQNLELLGYLLHPGTVIFGPWCSLGTYRQILEPVSWSLQTGTWWGVTVLLNLLVSGLSLIASTCLTSWLIPDNAGRWVLAYRDALSFRLSHYFVCHLSEASAALGGINSGPVARAQHVELPRSLLSVVTRWNVPMHTFLKKYVFEPVRGPAGALLAVISTYAASAVIHGLNGQLSAVLLSLALYTHAEHRLRCKLASAFDACVLARPCHKQPCTRHTNVGSSSTSLLINTVLGALCVWHLAYLGVMFDSSPSSSAGYSLAHTFDKWNKLHFASHWTVAATYVVTALI